MDKETRLELDSLRSEQMKLQNELNQLNQSFKAHRDRGDIHVNTKMVG